MNKDQSPLQCCCTIPLMSTACVCQMVYHWLPWCNAQIACTPIQLKASIKWKWRKLMMFILGLLHLMRT